MLKGLKNKFSNLRKKDAIVNKLDKIKGDQSPAVSDLEPIPYEFDAGKVEELQAETVNKIDEILNSKAEIINTNAESIKTIDKRLSKMDISISTFKRSQDEYNERFDKMEENLLELLSLYEIVSNNVNPFVGDSDNKSANLKKFEVIEKQLNNQKKLIDQLSDKMASLAIVTDEANEHIKNEFEEKLNEINEALKELRSEIASEMKVEDEGAQTEYHENQGPDLWPVNVQIPQKPNNGPLLEFINNDPGNSIVLLNWVEFLLEKVGRNNLIDVLDYYTDIGWIGEGVGNQILNYASGIDIYDEKPTWKLLPQDHTKSLMFIERLCGRRIDMRVFHKIERDVEKVKHHTDAYYDI